MHSRISYNRHNSFKAVIAAVISPSHWRVLVGQGALALVVHFVVGVILEHVEVVVVRVRVPDGETAVFLVGNLETITDIEWSFVNVCQNAFVVLNHPHTDRLLTFFSIVVVTNSEAGIFAILYLRRTYCCSQLHT